MNSVRLEQKQETTTYNFDACWQQMCVEII